MTTNISFQKTFGLLEKAMDVAKQRHSSMVGNVSNLDTPGYKARDIDFKSAMKQALDDGERVDVLKKQLANRGFNPNRLHLEFLDGNDGAGFRNAVKKFIKEIK